MVQHLQALCRARGDVDHVGLFRVCPQNEQHVQHRRWSLIRCIRERVDSGVRLVERFLRLRLARVQTECWRFIFLFASLHHSC